jgi:transketolase
VTTLDLDTTISGTARAIRRDALVAIHAAQSGHPGGCLSAADLLAHLFRSELRGLGSDDPGRDRFVLSKGHAAPALYAAAAAVGLADPALLTTLRQPGSPFQGHPDLRFAPWVETSTGSLGQGFSVGVGLALGLRHQGLAGRVYALLGDGELQEGEVWEAAMSAAHFGLANLCAVVDYNKLQSDATNEQIMRLEPLDERWRAFGWHVVELDGHDLDAIAAAFAEARATGDRPTVLLAHTIKGKGVSVMENVPAWHGSVALRDEELAAALEEIG